MNFLAHIYLSGPNPDLIIGNYIADFISNKELETYKPAIQRGIHLHRLIDSYTDQHPVVQLSKERLYPKHSKYASVIVDVFYDHLLARNWAVFSQESFPVFTSRVYPVLLAHVTHMPPFLKDITVGMISHNWLEKYKEQIGISRAINNLKNRASRPEYFEEAQQSLQQHYEELNDDFLLFFPDIRKEVQRFLDEEES